MMPAAPAAWQGHLRWLAAAGIAHARARMATGDLLDEFF
jgi:hypothetical protein